MAALLWVGQTAAGIRRSVTISLAESFAPDPADGAFVDFQLTGYSAATEGQSLKRYLKLAG